MSSDYQRLIEVINFLKEDRKVYNAKDFAEMVGVHPSYVSEATSNKRSITAKFIEKIEASFPQINGKYILTGEGEMLKSGAGLSESVRARLRSESVEPVPADTYTEVPFYDLSATAGLPRGEGSAGWLDTRLVPRQYAGAEFFVVRISGDSMDDGSSRSLCDGDEVVVKFEPVDMANGLPIRTKLFVVDTLEGAVVKQIIELNHSEGYVVLHSFNPLYPDYRVSLSEVLGFYSVQIFTQKRVRF